jgi:glycosyltransferase involved in cell wall biosynthesis
MNTPRVSVIMPSYQKARFIAEAIESVLAQTVTDLELIVVDSSTDDTSRVLERYSGRIQVLRTPPHGISAARNVGLKAARGAYIAFLDADDTWVPSKLERQLPLFDRHPRIGLVCTDVLFRDEQGLRPNRAFTDALPAAGMIHPLIFSRSFIGTLSVVVRRACLDDVGGFDEAITACEDHDLWLRISRTWAIDYVDEPLATYRYSADHASADRVRTLLGRASAPDSGLIRVQSRAYEANADLRALDRIALDRCFFGLHLELARLLIGDGRAALARTQLRRYWKLRGLTPALGRLMVESFLPRGRRA